MSVQYQTTVDWDVTLKDLEYTDSSTMPTALQGLVQTAIKVTAGAPTATAGKFIPGAIIQNAISAVNYQNTGSTASPVWSVIDVSAGGLPALASARFWVGNVGNVATAVLMSGDATMANTGAVTIGAGAVTAPKIGATFPFVGAALAGHSHDLQQVSAEVLSVTAGTGVSSAASQLPIAMVESVYITAGGVTGAVTVIPAGQTPATLECTYNPTTGVFQFLIADAVTAAVITYVVRPVTSVSAGTPAGTITPA